MPNSINLKEADNETIETIETIADDADDDISLVDSDYDLDFDELPDFDEYLAHEESMVFKEPPNFDKLDSPYDHTHDSCNKEADKLPASHAISHPPSPTKHNLSLEEPVTEKQECSEMDLMGSSSLFDSELKGMYANHDDISNKRGFLDKVNEIRKAYSRLADNKDSNSPSFIFAYRDQDASGTHVIFAHDEDSEKTAIKQASDFFERNCGYKDFTGRWVTDYCRTSSYASDLVRVITATNTRTDEREVIYVSSNVGVIRYNNLSNPNNTDINIEDAHKEQPISSLGDIECIITGLTIIGYLSFGADELQARNTTIEKAAKVMAVSISAAADFSSLPDGIGITDFGNGQPTRYISGMSSNDPLFVRISYSSTGEGLDYSSFAHKRRWSKANNSNKGNKDIELPPPAQTLSERIWVYGSMVKSSYYRLYEKRKLSANNLKQSLLFSEEFLRLFIEISNKEGGLAVRKITGAKDAYHVFLNCKQVHLKGLFRPKNVFELDLSPTSDYWQSSFSIFNIIEEGWSNQAIRYENWNDDAYQYDSMEGSYKQVLSHWLFTLVTDIYFNAKAFRRPRTLRPTKTLHSLNLNENIEVVSKGLVSSHPLKTTRAYGDSSAALLSDSYLFRFRLGVVQLRLGYSLFEITATRDDIENTYSFFLSNNGNGLIVGEDGDEESITILVSDSRDIVKRIWCIKDVTYALSVAKDVITSSDIAKSKGMDVYDAMREIDKTANSYGVDLKANFNL